VGPTRIDRVVGVAKAYTTRVGEGPFPTELDNEVGEALRTKGGEFGVTTGRPRRTGWFDAVVMRYATRINGLTDICLTKLDVLSGYETIPVCVAYEVDGVRTEEMPLDQAGFEAAVPVYEELPGWSEDISQCRSFDELPQAAQDYIKRLEELSRCRIHSTGVGAGRVLGGGADPPRESRRADEPQAARTSLYACCARPRRRYGARTSRSGARTADRYADGANGCEPQRPVRAAGECYRGGPLLPRLLETRLPEGARLPCGDHGG